MGQQDIQRCKNICGFCAVDSFLPPCTKWKTFGMMEKAAEMWRSIKSQTEWDCNGFRPEATFLKLPPPLFFSLCPSPVLDVDAPPPDLDRHPWNCPLNNTECMELGITIKGISFMFSVNLSHLTSGNITFHALLTLRKETTTANFPVQFCSKWLRACYQDANRALIKGCKGNYQTIGRAAAAGDGIIYLDVPDVMMMLVVCVSNSNAEEVEPWRLSWSAHCRASCYDLRSTHNCSATTS